jgi:hypothetical protein
VCRCVCPGVGINAVVGCMLRARLQKLCARLRCDQRATFALRARLMQRACTTNARVAVLSTQCAFDHADTLLSLSLEESLSSWSASARAGTRTLTHTPTHTQPRMALRSWRMCTHAKRMGWAGLGWAGVSACECECVGLPSDVAAQYPGAGESTDGEASDVLWRLDPVLPTPKYQHSCAPRAPPLPSAHTCL